MGTPVVEQAGRRSELRAPQGGILQTPPRDVGMSLTARKLPSALKVLELSKPHLLFILFSLVIKK